MIPEVGKIYNCFDDGKIRKSRLYTVEISEVLTPNEVDEETYSKWVNALKERENSAAGPPPLYAEETDYFVKVDSGEWGEPGCFVRTVDGGWFGIDTWINSGRLDVTGELSRSIGIDFPSQNKIQVKLSDIEKHMEFKKKVCSTSLNNIEFIDNNGHVIEIEQKIINEFMYTGLNNIDFITSGFYKTGFEIFINKNKQNNE